MIINIQYSFKYIFRKLKYIESNLLSKLKSCFGSFSNVTNNKIVFSNVGKMSNETYSRCFLTDVSLFLDIRINET